MSLHLGFCKCKNVTINLTLPQQLNTYTPRQCDCDFCTKRKIVYLSAPDAHLFIKSNQPLTSIIQGDKLADFLCCPDCQNLIAAVFPFQDTFKGSVNVKLLNEFKQLNKALIVSPKSLSRDEKQQRWKKLWMNVSIDQPKS